MPGPEQPFRIRTLPELLGDFLGNRGRNAPEVEQQEPSTIGNSDPSRAQAASSIETLFAKHDFESVHGPKGLRSRKVDPSAAIEVISQLYECMVNGPRGNIPGLLKKLVGIIRKDMSASAKELSVEGGKRVLVPDVFVGPTGFVPKIGGYLGNYFSLPKDRVPLNHLFVGPVSTCAPDFLTISRYVIHVLDDKGEAYELFAREKPTVDGPMWEWCSYKVDKKKDYHHVPTKLDIPYRRLVVSQDQPLIIDEHWDCLPPRAGKVKEALLIRRLAYGIEAQDNQPDQIPDKLSLINRSTLYEQIVTNGGGFATS